MKTLVVVALTLAAQISFAMPKVGDSATYNLNQTISGQNVTYTLTNTLTSYNAGNGQYLEQTTATYNGQSSVSSKAVLATNLLTDAKVTEYLTTCASIGGIPTAITVPAGTFNTCQVTYKDNNSVSIINIGMVAFGVVRFENTDNSGSHAVMELAAQTMAR